MELLQCSSRAKLVLACLLAFVVGALAQSSPSVPAQTKSCATAEHHAFYFWIGDWNAFDVDSPTKLVAHCQVTRILDGCVLLENYEGTNGSHGESFSIYDSSRKVWHQTWVTTRGELLEIEGQFANGEMVLTGKNQQGELVRGTWKPVDEGVREIGVKSGDGGKTWNPWFDIVFRHAPETASKPQMAVYDDAASDKETVAALDTEYQEAVKRNDAVTMDKILADDFTLVTSSGKVYKKSELLAEARSGRMAYEHQENSEKTVRLWGDTAVVTAKLWEKGTENGKPFEYKLWFSDVYRRTPTGWKYVFAQSAYRSGESIP